ncbi:protein of unknown function [Streptomyces sp. KY70]|nr:protein of unknown function [Streptomyces sp. KY70]
MDGPRSDGCGSPRPARYGILPHRRAGRMRATRRDTPSGGAVVRVSPRAAGFLHLGLVQMVTALGEFAPDLLLDRPEHVVVRGVVLLDDLEGPVAGDDVAAEDLPLDPVGLLPVPRLTEQPYGVVEAEVGAAGELVERVEGAAGPFSGLQRLREGAERLDGRVGDSVGALVRRVGRPGLRVHGSPRRRRRVRAAVHTLHLPRQRVGTPAVTSTRSKGYSFSSITPYLSLQRERWSNIHPHGEW